MVKKLRKNYQPEEDSFVKSLSSAIGTSKADLLNGLKSPKIAMGHPRVGGDLIFAIKSMADTGLRREMTTRPIILSVF